MTGRQVKKTDRPVMTTDLVATETDRVATETGGAVMTRLREQRLCLAPREDFNHNLFYVLIISGLAHDPGPILPNNYSNL